MDPTFRDISAEKESVVATSDLERMLDDWALAWSSGSSSDPEKVLALFAGPLKVQ